MKQVLAILLTMFVVNTTCLFAQTRVVRNTNGYTLMRNGEPYYVKGVGGDVQMDKMVAIGANSLRTWGVERAGEILDEAQKHGLTVMLGLWLQHERHGFDYNNTLAVAKQFNYFKTIIERYKNHPALLMWGIGNELDLNYTNPACWDAVQQIAQYIHQVDPNHPTSTVTAGLDSLEVAHIVKRCPDIDIYCINTYGDIGNVPSKMKPYGWHGPYMITEWGPNGHWESPQTTWNVSLEQTSTEKRAVYYSRYKSFIEPNKAYCLGSYAFLWGAKQEYTETWYGLFTKEQQATEPIDALEEVFTGKKPENPAPAISSFTLNDYPASSSILVDAGAKYTARVSLDFPEGKANNKVVYRWRIMQESTDKKSGGDKEEAATELTGLIRSPKNGSSIQFYAPALEGAYRLFVSATANNKVAYANIPFWVKPQQGDVKQQRPIQWKSVDMSSFNIIQDRD
ncbi:MAG: DUF4434 domain-containing protein [Chitinophagaceae bacterium]|nr:DUF4434 domain-containing protein [Chitinophagaceae bacterium]